MDPDLGHGINSRVHFRQEFLTDRHNLLPLVSRLPLRGQLQPAVDHLGDHALGGAHHPLGGALQLGPALSCVILLRERYQGRGCRLGVHTSEERG